MDYHFEGIKRLDWGFDNPNMTAALISMVAVSVFGAGLVWKKFFWPSLILGFVLFAGLHQTLSRGGMVAFGCGFIVLFVSIRPQLSRLKIVAILTMIVLFVGYANYYGGASRYVQGVNGKEDRSISNRWLIYKTVPRMIADAPGGWGRGQAAEAYKQWYQPVGRSESYLNLVNSHFTWLVEWPIWARMLYILLWGLVFIASWPYSKQRWQGIILAVWLTFFVAASFSSVAHRPWLWPFPAALFLIVVVHRHVTRQGFSMKRVLLVGAAPVVVYCMILGIAAITRSNAKIHHINGITTVGSPDAKAKIALCGNDQRILGERCGHRIRAFVKSRSGASITYYETVAALAAPYESVVLAGDAHENFKSPPQSNLYLLNPTGPAQTKDFENSRSVKVLWGSFNPSPAWYAWQARAAQTKGLELIQLPGEGLYLENWLDYLK